MSAEGLGGPQYVSVIPAAIPADRVLVHNDVRPTRRLGSRGFRAWLAAPTDHVQPCDCGWAPELTRHYRVGRETTPEEAAAALGRLSDEQCQKVVALLRLAKERKR